MRNKMVCFHACVLYLIFSLWHSASLRWTTCYSLAANIFMRHNQPRMSNNLQVDLKRGTHKIIFSPQVWMKFQCPVAAASLRVLCFLPSALAHGVQHTTHIPCRPGDTANICDAFSSSEFFFFLFILLSLQLHSVSSIKILIPDLMHPIAPVYLPLRATRGAATGVLHQRRDVDGRNYSDPHETLSPWCFWHSHIHSTLTRSHLNAKKKKKSLFHCARRHVVVGREVE